MKTKIFAATVVLYSLNGFSADTTLDIESLKRELKELRQRTEQLEKKLEAVEKGNVTNGPSGSTTVAVKSALPVVPPEVSEAPGSKPWSLSDPIRLGGNMANYMNVSFDALTAAGTSTEKDIESLQLGGHDPNQRGFTVQNLELTFDGK
ncbi:MAG: hypothetical protein JWM99_2297 [Verrucomicrobiales bacterium]|nr:hypothetical protein [Verrucomicrobiales bacterium]